MSQLVEVQLAPALDAGAAGGGILVLAVAGLVTALAGLGAVTAGVARGALELSRAVSEELRDAAAAERQARASAGAASYLRFVVPLSEEMDVLLAQILEERGYRVGRGGEMVLSDGSRLDLACAAFSAGGRLHLALRHDGSGQLEALCAGNDGLRDLSGVLAEAVERLAVASLGAHQYRVEQRSELPGGGLRMALARGGGRDRVTLLYDAQSGHLRIDARGVDTAGRPMIGAACPDLAPLLLSLRGYRRSPLGPWLPTDPGGPRPGPATGGARSRLTRREG